MARFQGMRVTFHQPLATNNQSDFALELPPNHWPFIPLASRLYVVHHSARPSLPLAVATLIHSLEVADWHAPTT